MEIKYVEEHTIFECIVGSQAYGINNQFSDTDYAGVMIPGKDYFLGLKKFDQFQGYPEQDKTIYDIRKALDLISDSNPNMLDLLYIPERCIIKITPFWQKVIENRALFLSKKAKFTFSGYAIAQINRIKTHRKFLLSPPKSKPERSSFGLPEIPMFPTSQIKAVCYASLELIRPEDKERFTWELDKIYADYLVPHFANFIIPEERILAMEWLQVGLKSQLNTFLSLGAQYVKDEYLEEAKKELSYYNAMQEFRQYMEWKKGRNEKRAEIEAKFFYDTKHAAHNVRLLRMGAEALKTGTIFVDRTNIDAEELKAIRAGAWSFEQLEEYAKNMDEELNRLYEESTLQKTPQREKISDLCVEIVDEYFDCWRK